MFDKLKGLAGNASKMWEMKKQIDEMKKALEKIVLSEEDRNVKVTVSGSLEVREIEIKCDLKTIEPYQLQISIKEMTNKAFKQAQKEAARQMQSMGGIPGL